MRDFLEGVVAAIILVGLAFCVLAFFGVIISLCVTTITGSDFGFWKGFASAVLLSIATVRFSIKAERY
jgi:hypothetical protein